VQEHDPGRAGEVERRDRGREKLPAGESGQTAGRGR